MLSLELRCAWTSTSCHGLSMRLLNLSDDNCLLTVQAIMEGTLTGKGHNSSYNVFNFQEFSSDFMPAPRQAFRIACSGRPGPCHIDLPKD